MKSLFSIIAAVLMLCGFTQAWGRAGGGISVGRVSSPSYSHPSAPRYSAPSPPRLYASPAPSNTATTVINNRSGGGFGSSFLGGMAGAVIGNELTHQNSSAGAPVQSMQMNAPVAGFSQPAQIAVQEGSGRGWFWFSVFLTFVVITAFIVWLASRKKVEGAHVDDFDSLTFFYRLQQACMDDDQVTLRNMCTPGMATALSGNPEPGCIAKDSFTGVTHSDLDWETVEYRFTDAVDGGRRVTERWCIHGGKLVGIEVVA